MLTKGASATVKRCSFYNCLHAICNEGGKVQVEDCLFSHCGTKDFRTCSALYGGTISATRLRFIDCSWIAVWVNSHTTFDHCQFKVVERSHYASQYKTSDFGAYPRGSHDFAIEFFVFHPIAGSTVFCNDCEFQGYDGVSNQTGSKTNVSLQRCRISTVVGLAEVKENAGMSVTDCNVDTVYLMKIGYNAKGKIVFSKNSFSAKTRRLFLVDDMSKPLLSHLNGFQFEEAIFHNVLYLAHDKKQASYTKKYIAERLNTPAEKDAPLCDSCYMKMCEFCMKREGFEAISAHTLGGKVAPIKKFQFCSKCRQVCYCSKDCQAKHWADHKLSCPDRAEPKSSRKR